MFETVLRLISSIVKIDLLAYCLLCCLFLLKETPYTFGLFYSFSFQRSTLFVALFQQLLYLNRLLSECQQLFSFIFEKVLKLNWQLWNNNIQQKVCQHLLFIVRSTYFSDVIDNIILKNNVKYFSTVFQNNFIIIENGLANC